MKIYDISVPISRTSVVWPDDPKVAIRKLSKIANGDEVNISQISMSLHTGTHIDAPNHFIDNGKTIDQVPLAKLVGEVLVMSFEDHIKVINEHALVSHPMLKDLLTAKKVLFKTSNSSYLDMSQGKFSEDYVGIDKSGAHYLAGLNLDLIGLDYLSVAIFDDTQDPHQILLSKEIVLLEGITIKHVSPGFYDLYCLPLPVSGSDGSPARTILIQENEEIK
jgi:arylformamidase